MKKILAISYKLKPSFGFTPLEAARPKGPSGAPARAWLLTGFTLIEAVIAAGVFALASTSIVGVYTSIQRINRRSAALEAIEQNIRFLSEDLTKTIASGSVDYGSYAGGLVPQPYTSDLFLFDRNNNRLRIYQSGDALILQKTTAGVTAVYTGSDIKIIGFKAYVYPQSDPFPITVGTPREQPTVTIYLEFESNIGPQDIVRQIYQVTAATRQYPESL